jgi:zinc protease
VTGLARILLLVTLLGCAQRPQLPAPLEPLTRTPDAPFRRQPPPMRGQPDLRMPEVATHALENGVQLFTVERHDVPTVTVIFSSRLAGELHAGGEAGLAVLTGDMLIRGTRRLEVDRQLPSVATTMLHTQLSLEVLSDSFELSVRALAAAAMQPSFDATELERQRRVQIEILRDESRRIDGILRMLAARLRFGNDDRLAILPSGDFEQVKRFDIEDLRRFHWRAFRPDASAVFVVGDVSGESARQSIEAQFASWAPPPAPPDARRRPPARDQKQYEQRIHAIAGAGDQTHVLIASPGPPRASQDFDACTLLSYVLGRLFASRGNQALRHTTGASYGAQLEMESLSDRGEVYFTAIVDSKSAGDAVQAMLAELVRVGREPVSPSELAAAKARYLAEVQAALATNSGTAQLLAELHAFGLGLDHLQHLEERVRAIDADRLRIVAERYLDPARARVLVYTQLDDTLRDLLRVAPVARYELR